MTRQPAKGSSDESSPVEAVRDKRDGEAGEPRGYRKPGADEDRPNPVDRPVPMPPD